MGAPDSTGDVGCPETNPTRGIIIFVGALVAFGLWVVETIFDQND